MRIVIIGGGIGGLTAAIALGKAGIDAHVYEKAPELREVGAGIGLMPNALKALDILGLGDDIREQCGTGVQGGVKNSRGRVLVEIPADELARSFGSVFVMHRAELLAFLVNQLRPEQIHLGWACTGFEQNSDRVVARFENGETVSGDCLLGADGLRSIVRKQLLGDPVIRYSGYTAWRSVVEFKSSERLSIVETWGRGRRFGIVPMGRNRVYWFATNSTAEAGRDRKGETKPALLTLFQGWHEPIESLIRAAREDAILRNDIYDFDPLPRFVSGRTGLLGDAAHAMTPNLGQGACQAIEDAVVLAACLKHAEQVEAALLEYERRRRPRTAEVVLRARSLGNVGQAANPAMCWLRDTAMRLTPRQVAARQIRSLLDFEIVTPSEKAFFRY